MCRPPNRPRSFSRAIGAQREEFFRATSEDPRGLFERVTSGHDCEALVTVMPLPVVSRAEYD